jgi:anti-sigma factor RsiW
MRHRRARRLLTQLLDGSPGPRLRRELQAHVRGCPECRRRLRQHETAELLLRLLPRTLLPSEPSRAAQVRLWGLARWFVDPLAAWRERLELGAVGLGVALFTVVVTMSVDWHPEGAHPTGLVVLAQAVAPDAGSMLPVGWR